MFKQAKGKGYNKTMKKNVRRGSVSLYVVIFTTLLLSIISLGFLRVMLAEQESASNQDLSNSAYDSAMAGVEDGKAVIMAYQECASRGFPTGVTVGGMRCFDVKAAIDSRNCDTIDTARGNLEEGTGRPETSLDQGSSDTESGALDQAYTCVIIRPDTEDYLMQLSSEQPSVVIPLRFTNNVNSMILSWWRAEDAKGEEIPNVQDRCDDDGTHCFAQQGGWAENEPPVIRWQLANPGSSFTLDRLNQSNAHAALFFVPTTTGANTWNLDRPVPASMVTASGEAVTNGVAYDDIRFDGTGTINGGHTPLPVQCFRNYDHNGGYSCSVKINLPEVIPANSNSALLRLTAYYGSATTISVAGYMDNNPISFSAVQPEIDSTGRASDLFRRVLTRVDLADAYFPYPEYSLELRDSNANLCKNFMVWNSGSTNLDSGCNP